MRSGWGWEDWTSDCNRLSGLKAKSQYGATAEITLASEQGWELSPDLFCDDGKDKHPLVPISPFISDSFRRLFFVSISRLQTWLGELSFLRQYWKNWDWWSDLSKSYPQLGLYSCYCQPRKATLSVTTLLKITQIAQQSDKLLEKRLTAGFEAQPL